MNGVVTIARRRCSFQEGRGAGQDWTKVKKKKKLPQLPLRLGRKMELEVT